MSEKLYTLADLQATREEERRFWIEGLKEVRSFALKVFPSNYDRGKIDAYDSLIELISNRTIGPIETRTEIEAEGKEQIAQCPECGAPSLFVHRPGCKIGEAFQ